MFRLMFLAMIVVAASILIRNSSSRTTQTSFIITLCAAAVFLNTRKMGNYLERFEEQAVDTSKQTSNVNEPKESDKTSPPTSSTTNIEEASKNEFVEFKDEYVNLFSKHSLVYYTSTFDKRYVSTANNQLLNAIGSSRLKDSENAMTIPADVKYILDQRDGLYINFKQPLSTIYPRELNFNTQEFTIQWYGRFVPMKYDSTIFKQSVFFVNVPVHDATNIIGIEFEFRSEYVNPTIQIHWKGKPLEDAIYSFSSSSSDEDKKKNFYDGRYHMFTLIKTKDNELKLLLDDQTHTTSPLISSVIKNEENPIINEKNSYKITLNSNTEDPTSVDDKTLPKAPNAALNFHMCSFAIFNEAVNLSQVTEMFKHFETVRYQLDPRTISLKKEIDQIKTDSKCPFSDKTLCETPNCLTTDWRDQSSILSNEKCFDDVAKYCSSIDSFANDKMCTFYDRTNANKVASLLQSDEIKVQGEDIDEEEEIVKQLRKLGLNNIHLDKSLRANGKYSDEINQLIDKIYEQKEMNIKGLSTLEDVEDVKHAPLKYEDVVEVPSDPDLNDSSKPASAPPRPVPRSSKPRTKESATKSELIDLKYSDLEDYNNIMSEYEKSSNSKEIIQETKPTSLLGRIFG